MTPEKADYSTCTLRPFRDASGACRRCGSKLSGTRRAWCTDDCREADEREHIWPLAREAVLRRDGRACVTCGSNDRLEVNHREPRVGRGYLTGCWNHHDNLETLCKRCHVEVTKEQGAMRKNPGAEALALFGGAA